jgi:hypothetical protein
MAARTRYRVAVAISSNPDNEERDLGNTLSEVVNDSLGGRRHVAECTACPTRLIVPVQLTQGYQRAVYLRACVPQRSEHQPGGNHAQEECDRRRSVDGGAAAQRQRSAVYDYDGWRYRALSVEFPHQLLRCGVIIVMAG